MTRRGRLIQGLVVAAVVGGYNLWKNGVSWGNGVAAVLIFPICLGVLAVRDRWFNPRGPRNPGSDVPGDLGDFGKPGAGKDGGTTAK